jgi:hypothetical protein
MLFPLVEAKRLPFGCRAAERRYAVADLSRSSIVATAPACALATTWA